MMNVRPIPNALLGDSFTLYSPTASGWNAVVIRNVRAERVSAVSEPSSQSARDNTSLTIWYDFRNSSPRADFEAGMRARYFGEIFEIVEVRVYRAETPHHCKLKCRKIGGERSEVNI